MGNNNNSGGRGGIWGWMPRPPSQIIEERKAGLPVDFTLPVLQAVAPGILLGWCLFVTGAALWAAAPVSIYMLAVVFAFASIIFHVQWKEAAKAVWATFACCFIAWALSRGLAWLFFWQPWGRYAAAALLCATVGSWLAFILLLVAFGLELVQRSGAMEEHGYHFGFEWLFGYFLRRPRPKPEPPPTVKVEFTYKDNGRVTALRDFDLPVSLPKMEAVARRVLLFNDTFSEPNMAGNGKPLSGRPEYEALRDALLKCDKPRFLVWRVEGARTQGVEFTEAGLALLRGFLDGGNGASPPHPTSPNGVREGRGTNENERTDANER